MFLVDVTDEEILAYTRSKNDPADPEGTYLFRNFRTNQLLSKLMRGARQTGMPKEVFNPHTYLEVRDQTVREMRASCYDVLHTLVAKVTGKSMFAMLRPPPAEPHDFL